jgi:hypothetical protein
MSDAVSGPAAGWYPDPAGSGRTRWWDGTRWTESFTEAAVVPVQAPASPAAMTPAPSPYPNAAPYSGVAEQLSAPAGTSPYTPFIWVLALLPLVNLVISIVQLPQLDDTIASATAGADQITAVDFTSSLVSIVLFGAAMLLIVLDWRALNRAGVPRPFHWAWGFFMILGAPVYMIGRSIVVRRRTGSGLAPMVVNLSLIVLEFGLGLAVLIIGFAAILENTPVQ